jgi:hypothetical protein
MQYLPPVPDSTHWKLHFDGSKILADGDIELVVVMRDIK